MYSISILSHRKLTDHFILIHRQFSHKSQVNTIIQRHYVHFKRLGIFLIIKSSLHQSLMIYLPKHFTTEHINNYQVIKTTWKGTWKYFSHNIGRQQRAEAARTKVWLLIRQVAVSFYFLCLDMGVTAPNSFLRLSCDFLIPGSSQIRFLSQGRNKIINSLNQKPQLWNKLNLLVINSTKNQNKNIGIIPM